MKARIAKELEELINEKIYLDLEVHLLGKKIEGIQKTNQMVSQIEKLVEQKIKKLKTVNEKLRKQNVKIHPPISDGLFVQYNFYVKNGGYKEGNFRYWKSAIKFTLNQRLNPFFNGN
ncbi:hypothetical protein V7659_25005 [Neobacillus drentensis]|uniref:hypothetical protein n=1 Tax=Neobacillus drentensis TaxID=220684 RepID=UPI002FFEEC8E